MNGAAAVAVVAAAVSLSADASFGATASVTRAGSANFSASVQSIFAGQGNVFGRWDESVQAQFFAEPNVLSAGAGNWLAEASFQPMVLRTASAEAAMEFRSDWYAIADAQLGDFNFLARLTVSMEASQQRAAFGEWFSAGNDIAIGEADRIAGTTIDFVVQADFRAESSVRRNGSTFVEHDGFFFPRQELTWESTQFLEGIFTTGGFQSATATLEAPASLIHGATAVWAAQATLIQDGVRVVLSDASWSAGLLFDANQTLIHLAEPEALEASAGLVMRANALYAPTAAWRDDVQFAAEPSVTRFARSVLATDSQLEATATVVKLGFGIHVAGADIGMTAVVTRYAQATWDGFGSTMDSSSVLRQVPAADERVFIVPRVPRDFYVPRRAATFEVSE